LAQPSGMISPQASGLLRGRGISLRAVLLVVAASLFTAASAQISVPLPFSPVPITGQTLAVLLTGAVLGPRAGALAMLLYLGEGAGGLPFFAQARGGLSILSGATGGYLYAFPPAAFVVGWLIDWEARRSRQTMRVAPTIVVLLLGNAIIYGLGVFWLGYSLHLGAAKAADLGLWPFIPGDLCKLIIVAMAISSGRRLLRPL